MKVEYDVTLELAPASEQAWRQWQSEKHIPEVLAEPGFLGARMLRDTHLAEDGWVRYRIAYLLSDRASFDRYTQSEAAARLRKDFLDHFSAVARVSRQVLEEVETFGRSG